MQLEGQPPPTLIRLPNLLHHPSAYSTTQAEEG